LLRAARKSRIAPVRGWIGGAALAWALVLATPATAQEDPSVTGKASGGADRGAPVTITVTGTHPDGWRTLHELGVDIELNGVALEEIRYDVDRGEVSVGTSTALLGTGNVAEGRFVRIPAIDVSQTTGGQRASVTMRARLIADLPPGSRIRFSAEDDFGGDATSTQGLPQPEDASFGVSTLAVAIAVALLGGGLIGARVAAHRRPDPRESVYGTVARRIREERERT
jgi:hypothetical protein